MLVQTRDLLSLEVRNKIKEKFLSINPSKIIKNLSTPHGVEYNQEIYWSEDFELWGRFRDEVSTGQQRWFCWFGSSLGDGKGALTPDVEINIPITEECGQISGSGLVDSEGRYYLGHKGGLGGGRRSVKREVFSKIIKGFSREPVQINEKENLLFIIGEVDSDNFLYRLKKYVDECNRIRSMEMEDIKIVEEKSEFNPENEENGSRDGGGDEAIFIRRLHGKIVNALKEYLGDSAYNSSKSKMWPDLYILGEDNKMSSLFEVKVSSDTQSIFTAIGQLLVYGSGQSVAPTRYLVCPAEIQDPNFQKVFIDQKINIIVYKIIKGKICFENIYEYKF